jgi:hypothetical protein
LKRAIRKWINGTNVCMILYNDSILSTCQQTLIREHGKTMV